MPPKPKSPGSANNCHNSNHSGLALISANRLALVAGLAAALLALLAGAEPAHACSCARSGSPAEALERADAVFAGEVTSVKFSGTSPYRLSLAALVTVEFRVTRVWKGPRWPTLTVETERSEISCGYEFKEGQNYIVYTWKGNRTGLCTRTAPAWMAFADFVALGPGHPPEASPDAKTAEGGACAAPSSRGSKPMDIASLSLLAGVIALGIRRRPRL